MSLISNITNGELMSSVRSKLNSLIEYINNMFLNANDNIKIGEDSLSSDVDVSRCVAIGSDSMRYKTNGSYSTALGYQSQYLDSVGIRNTSLGYKSLLLTTVSRDNVAIGYKALENLKATSGQITGYVYAGSGKVTVTSASHGLSNGNTIYIFGTGQFSDHSYTDNYDGYHDISNVTADTFEITATYISSALITDGWWGIFSEGNGNTAVGVDSGALIQKGSYNITIGFYADVDDPNGDHQLSIGNVLKGNLENGKLYVTGDTFGIATSKTPISAIDTGTTGQIAWDADYIYVCVATNTWKRVAISSW